MLFYFNINVCRDLPYVIYHKQYVTVYLKLHNLRLALGMNIKTVMLCIKTGFRLERFQSKQDLLYSWNTSVLSCVWIQKNFQGIKKGGGGSNAFFGSFTTLYVDLRGSLNFSGGGWGCLIIMYLYVCVH